MAVAAWTLVLQQAVPPLQVKGHVDADACTAFLQSMARLACTCSKLRRLCAAAPAAALSQAAVVGNNKGPRCHVRCSTLCVWLHPHATQIRHLHIEGPFLEGHALCILLRQLCSLKSLCVVDLSAATGPPLARALRQSQAPVTAFSCSGSCWPSSLPRSIEQLRLRLKWAEPQAVTHGAVISAALVTELRGLPGLHRLWVHLSGRDSCPVDSDSNPACAGNELLYSLVRTEIMPPDDSDDELHLIKLEELVITQQLEQADWEQSAPELQGESLEEAAMLYMTRLQDDASYNMHGLQQRPDRLPALRLARLKTILRVTPGFSESASGGGDARKQLKLLVHSIFQLHPQTMLRQIDSLRDVSSTAV